MPAVNRVYCFLVIFFLAFAIPLSGYIMTYLKHAHIVLLGDDHCCLANDLERRHLVSLMKCLLKSEQPAVLVEDRYAATNRRLKDLASSALKVSLLAGFIQRLQGEKFPVVCIDKGNTLVRAYWFAYWGGLGVPFEDLSPKKLKAEGLANGYNVRFLDLVNEIKALRQALEDRRKSQTYEPAVQSFIDSMEGKMDEQLANLYQVLLSHNIKESESILETAVRYWFLKKINEHKAKVDDIVSVCHKMEGFIDDYKQGMSKDEWLSKSKELRDECSRATRKLEVKQPEPQKPSWWAKIVASFMLLPCVKKCFKWLFKYSPEKAGHGVHLQEVAVRPSEPIAWPALDNPMDKIRKCFMELRLLVVDSHATLDVIDHKDTRVVLIAGDDHVKNISSYLSQLGFPQTEQMVRDVKLEHRPFDLEKLPILAT